MSARLHLPAFWNNLNSMDRLFCVLARWALAMPSLNAIRKRTSRSATSRPAKSQTTSWRSAWTLAEPGITHAPVGARGES
jgi:hypothetical protein